MDTKKTERGCLAQSAIHSTNHRARYITKTASIFLGSALSLLTAQSALAGNVAWDNESTDNNWQTATNWVGDVLPTNTDVAVFDLGGTNTVNNAGSVDVQGFNFDTNAGSFTINNQLAGDMTIDGGIENGSTADQFLVNDGMLFLGDGDVASGVFITNNGTLSVSNAADVTINEGIDGTGGLTKSGAGTLTLLGDSTFEGDLSINSGDVQLGDGTDNDGTLTSDVVIGATSTMIINPASGDFTVAAGQTFSGDGELTWSGAGDFTLIGTDNVATTNIDSGNFFVGDGTDGSGVLGSASVVLGDSTQMWFNNPTGDAENPFVFSGIISGAVDVDTAGTVTINSGETTIFTGANTYTGQTNIEIGSTLQLGDGADTGSVAGDVNIAYDANLVIKPDSTNSNYTVGDSQTLSGDGTVTWDGTDTFTLLGTDSAARTVINSGNFVVGDGSDGSGNLSGNVELGDSTQMTFNNPTGDSDNPFIYSGVISDQAGVTTHGVVTIDGGEKVIFTGNNTYMGQTIINVGSTLQMGNDTQNGSISGDVEILGTLECDHTLGPIYGGVITGNGSLIQSGNSVLTLLGTSGEFTGTTTVQNGTLLIGNTVDTATTAMLGGDVTVKTGATLGGFGTIGNGVTGSASGSVTIESGGNMSPGASIGTVTINGDYTQQTGSTYTVETNYAGASDSLVVDGTATIENGSELVIDVSEGFKHLNSDGTDYTYTILTSGDLVVGDSIDDSSVTVIGANGQATPFIEGNADFNSDTNEITIAPDFDTDAFEAAYDTANQTAVGNYLIATGGTAQIQGLVASLSTDAQLQKALDQISGATYANQILQVGQAGRWFDSQLADRMGFYPKCEGVMDPKSSQTWPTNCAPGKSLWVLPYGSSATIDTDNVGGLDTSMGGVAIGADFEVAPGAMVGAAVAGTYFSSDAEGNEDASADGTLYQFGVYGSYVMKKDWTLGASVAVGGTNDIDTTRTINTATGSTTTDGSYSSTVVSEQLRLSYDKMMNGSHIKPFIGLVGQQVSGDSFTETGNVDFALNVSDLDYNSFKSQLGSSVEVPMGRVTFLGSVAWQHEFADDQGSFTGYINQLGGTHSFNIVGTDIGNDSALIKAGFVLLEKGRVNVTALYEGMFANNYSENGGKVQIDFDLG